MLFTFKEKCFIKILRQEKGWGGKRKGLLVRLTIFYGKSSVASHRLIKGRKHFSESMMASVAVSKAGKTSVNFIDSATKEPRRMQVTTAKLCCSDVFSRRRFVRSPTIISCFNKTAHRLIECLQLTVPNFVQTSVRPPNSPDLNPVDYALWIELCSRACIAFQFPTWTISRTECAPAGSLDQQIINKSIYQWRDRLKAVLRVNGTWAH